MLLRQGERVLLVRKSRGPYTGKWDLPGGKIEFGETPEEAARREVQEETGLLPLHLHLVKMLSHNLIWHRPDGREEHLHHLGVIYHASETQGALHDDGDNEDADRAAWQDTGALPASRLTPFAQRALRGEER